MTVEDCYRNLGCEVVLFAAKEYAAALAGRRVNRQDPEFTINTCRSFFSSGMVEFLTIGRIHGSEVQAAVEDGRIKPGDNHKNGRFK